MKLIHISKEIRKNIVRMNSRVNASHSGAALSIVDILVVLYFRVMKVSPNDPSRKDRDKLLLSKGHGSSALYSTLAIKGYFDVDILNKFYINDGILPGHLDKDSVPGVEISSGSLGHGLPIGVGMAIANKIDKLPSQIYVISGDGELNEGSMWEAIMFAAHHKLNNLTLIVDYNKLQGYGKTNEVMNLEPLTDKFLAFNWDVFKVDGHNYNDIENTLLTSSNRPKVIIANTIKGKGVSYMENEFVWHYKSPNADELQQALKELS